MTTLVTGATGLVGLNLVRKLVSQGERVRIFARPSKHPRLGLDDLDVEHAAGDVTDQESIEKAMKGVARVYHVAGNTSQGPWRSVRRRLEEVNVGGTENVCAAARKAGVERLVHTSSIAAIGYGPRENPATEETVWNFGRLGGPYYDTKRAAEHVVSKHVEAGLDAVIVNPGYMFGPWDVKPTSGFPVLMAAQRKRGIPLYPTGGGINVLDVEDAAQGHILAMQKGKRGERYILGNENLTWREVFTLANEVSGKPPPWLPVNLFVAYPFGLLLNVIGRFAPHTFDNYNTLTLRAGATGHYVSAKKALTELGLPVTPVKKSMEKALEWFRSHDYFQLPQRRTRARSR
ncbi:SDR family oxidoreductase, partial [bacterium]|nr:SDR family oxidoreductase [bacterium]